MQCVFLTLVNTRLKRNFNFKQIKEIMIFQS